MGKRIEWKGGECPVRLDTKVRIYTRDGCEDEDIADSYYWQDDGDNCDIIAYEVIEEAKEEPKQIIEKTLRDEFAMVWLKGFPRIGDNVDEIADECYDIADAMMKARAK